jgi:hypothetical protein
MEEICVSKDILKSFIDEFDIKKGRPNKEYLEFQLNRLENMADKFGLLSISKDQPTFIRARNRDKHQNVLGIINGIKFALSYMEHQHVDLMEKEGLNAKVEAKT